MGHPRRRRKGVEAALPLIESKETDLVAAPS